MQPCKIDSENWTYFRFHFQRVSFRSLIVELATILDKTQVWPRKSILYVQISQTWITKYFKLIRDNHKTFFGDETLNLRLGGAGKWGLVISVGSSVQLTQRRRPFGPLASFWIDDLLFCIDYTDEPTLITIPHFPAPLSWRFKVSSPKNGLWLSLISKKYFIIQV